MTLYSVGISGLLSGLLEDPVVGLRVARHDNFDQTMEPATTSSAPALDRRFFQPRGARVLAA